MSKRWPDKLIVGLTGNIATGKSAVMHMAAKRGALAIDADKEVHELQESDSALQDLILTEFGPRVRSEDGGIDRNVLGTIVFSDPDALQRLEQIIHPIVREAIFQRIDESDARIVFVEAIKLLEGSLAAECDQIWATRCSVAQQIERLRRYRGMDAETAALRVNAQPPQQEKVAMADVVIDTGGTMAETHLYFNLAWNRLVADIQMDPSEGPISTADSNRVEPRPTPPPASPPRRLDAAGAVDLREKFKTGDTVTTVYQSSSGNNMPEAATDSFEQVLVRRARPSDIPSILLLIQRATAGVVAMKRTELLLALSERGYLIGQMGTEVSTVVGWSSENLVAVIDEFYVSPLEAVSATGVAVLHEIERTANQLICEVILAFPDTDVLDVVHRLFVTAGYKSVTLGQLPRVWRIAAGESQRDDGRVLVKKLRGTRDIKPL